MNTAFTPGPWRAVDDDGDWYIAERDRIVADIEPMPRNAAVRANAHLIAAAPDMYAVLDELLRNGEMAIEKAQAALAKARGEQVSA